MLEIDEGAAEGSRRRSRVGGRFRGNAGALDEPDQAETASGIDTAGASTASTRALGDPPSQA